jgi:hypothetical protein
VCLAQRPVPEPALLTLLLLLLLLSLLDSTAAFVLPSMLDPSPLHLCLLFTCCSASPAFPAVPNYRQLCSKLHQLRLDAAHMSCAWLNDQYLSLQAMHDSPADSGIALVLHSVWWLDVGGSIPGEWHHQF